MARIGLRMMPTFPSSPLKFRTVGFPQSGFKAGSSDGAFPVPPHESPGPVCHRPSCPSLTLSFPRSGSEDKAAGKHRRSSRHGRSTPGVLAPVRVIVSRSILTYSTPSAPLAGTSGLHRRAAYTRYLRCASPATPRRPTTGSVLSLAVLYRHAVLRDHGKFIGCLYPVPSSMTLAFDQGIRSRHFQVLPPSDSRGRGGFRGLTTVRFRYGLSICLSSCRS